MIEIYAWVKWLHVIGAAVISTGLRAAFTSGSRCAAKAGVCGRGRSAASRRLAVHASGGDPAAVTGILMARAAGCALRDVDPRGSGARARRRVLDPGRLHPAAAAFGRRKRARARRSRPVPPCAPLGRPGLARVHRDGDDGVADDRAARVKAGR